ncbi:glycosyltransferase [Mucilaginibacter sp. OK098]|uniref:glycosyltransferase n=1 Tax=Mucilaginibacter sp. OK098 TaxID=1855297 RepID=UPI000916B6A1|nr:glycosyltransferase [Mucilaginibacter sp. OK098]SHN24098.1 Glycosyl transferase family 2 [Mucilaginibacter sp. OK098]
MSLYKLSFIIATRNRLPFLKITLEKLINELLPGEEIVVVDGNSTDGASEYLQQLFEQGKIHQFISEPDHNQAHGWNKALLMAKGTIIKKIIDDDVHSYTAIRKCADFMLSNPQVDICISNCLTTDLETPKNIQTTGRLKYYEAWKAGKTPCFTFSDVYLLIRKSSLAYLGLFDTQFAMLDWEYSLRCSWLKASIAYYTGYNALAVSTQGNVTSSTNAARLKTEGLIGKAKYGYKGDRSDISLYSELKIAVGKAINYKAGSSVITANQSSEAGTERLGFVYNNLYTIIEDYNRAIDARFIL